jgi:hypothetical protein
LVKQGYVTKEARPGMTSVLRLAILSKTIHQPTGKGYPPGKNAEVSKAGDTRGNPIPDHRGEKDTHKGSPFKVLPEGRGAVARFTPPTVEEVKLHAAKIGLPAREAEKFHAHFESNGWRVGGRSPMKNWSASLTGWKLRWEERGRPATKGATSEHPRNVGTY